MSNSPRRFGCIGVIVVVLLVISLVFNAFFVAGNMIGIGGGPTSKFHEVLVQKSAPDVSSKIALIQLRGLITSMLPGHVGDSMVDDLKLRLKAALDDKEVRGIVLAIDSPGGEVTASDIIYNAVKKAKATKPVVISMGSLAASGGYYVATAGNHIFAHDTTFTGSIGVIMQSLNYTDLMGKVGLETVTFKSGQFKDMLSGSRRLTPEESQYVQGMVMQTYDKFVGIVAAERGIPEPQLRAGVADGRVLTGKDALAAKLVDDLGDLDAAITKAMQLAGAPGSAVVKYEAPVNYARLLSMFGGAESRAKVEVNLGPQSALKLEPGRIYLLPGVLVP